MDKATVIAIGAGLGLAMVYLSKDGAGSAAKALGAAAVDVIDGTVSGVVIGIGDKIGLPDTSKPSVVDQGRAELAAGDYWNASFHLPAGEFLSGTWERLWK